MAKVPERGLTDQVAANVRAMMLALQQQHRTHPPHERVLRLAVMGGLHVMPGGEAEGGGDVILSHGAHREFTVHAPRELRLENLADTLASKARQRNTVEIYMQLNHPNANGHTMRQLMQELQQEVRAGRRDSLRGIYIRLFDRHGEDLWEGRLY